MDISLLNELAMRHLQAQGYIVTLPPQFRDFIPVADLGKQFNLDGNALHRRLYHAECPDYEHEGTDGRMMKIRPNPALIAFLAQPKQAGKPLKPAHLLQQSACQAPGE